jgi:hypothetical protein
MIAPQHVEENGGPNCRKEQVQSTPGGGQFRSALEGELWSPETPFQFAQHCLQVAELVAINVGHFSQSMFYLLASLLGVSTITLSRFGLPGRFGEIEERQGDLQFRMDEVDAISIRLCS